MKTTSVPRPQPKASAILQAGVEEFAVRAYPDANTDRITASCGISKGLLYHYFGTKKKLYMACLQHALDTLAQETEPPPAGDFYSMLFAGMESKLQLCAAHPAETMLLNLASREFAQEVRVEKDALLRQYAQRIRTRSQQVMAAAITALPLKCADRPLVVRGLTLYINALVSRYLTLYQNEPQAFFARREAIAGELKTYIDLMLYGVCQEEKP